ncbi:MAG: hypothetical protein WD009_00925 [Phycisphaeraceae bacterium]
MEDRSEWLTRRAPHTAAAMLLGLVALAGCDGGGGGGRATYPDVGMVMQLPPGWSQDASGMHAQRGHRDDHHGMAYLAALEADSLDDHVAGLADVERGLVSREPITVDGHEAIELITQAAYSLYEVYVLRGDEVVVVSFRTLPHAFDDQRPAFRDAVQSIRFQ